ncbi:GNAT family N-acetyltransferase [Inquilinus limosus]|uniref:GNAT family N-acetyltransferase n=1 Tax=Inquilinus limosus TaxID=171674 RepID=UPI0003F68781|nr:GNAT family N-acetyltransferase [Inquilinus limosus]
MIHDTPPPTLRPMTEHDLPALHALTVEVGWAHRPEDWRFVTEVGEGVVACDGAGRVIGSAMWWPFGTDFGTVGMIIVSPRLQAKGTGRRMMRWLFDRAGDRALQLNATPAGLRLYRSEGFRETGRIHQHQGTVQPVPAASVAGLVRPLAAEDWPRVRMLDREAFGADRSATLDALAARSVGTAYEADGELVGFSLCRPFGRGHVVGPIVAPDEAAAIALLQPHLEEHAGRFLRVDTPDDGAFADRLAAAGLARVDTVATMRRGDRPARQPAVRTFGLINQALG